MRRLPLTIIGLILVCATIGPAQGESAQCELLFSKSATSEALVKSEYVNLVPEGAKLFDNWSSHEFRFSLFQDRVEIQPLGAFAETAEGQKVFPPIVFPIQRPWRIVVNMHHRIVMVLGNEPLILTYHHGNSPETGGWRQLTGR